MLPRMCTVCSGSVRGCREGPSVLQKGSNAICICEKVQSYVNNVIWAGYVYWEDCCCLWSGTLQQCTVLDVVIVLLESLELASHARALNSNGYSKWQIVIGPWCHLHKAIASLYRLVTVPESLVWDVGFHCEIMWVLLSIAFIWPLPSSTSSAWSLCSLVLQKAACVWTCKVLIHTERFVVSAVCAAPGWRWPCLSQKMISDPYP